MIANGEWHLMGNNEFRVSLKNNNECRIAFDISIVTKMVKFFNRVVG